MSGLEELSFGGIATLGAVASVCAVLLRSTHHNIKTLETLRREAHTACENLRRQLRDHDNTIFKLQGLCTEYHYALSKLEDENHRLRQALAQHCGPQQGQAPPAQLPEESNAQTSRPQDKFQTRPEDVL